MEMQEQPQEGVEQTSSTSVENQDTTLNKTEKLKRVFFQILIACLLGAASIAVVAVLVGSFSETLGRALGTIALVALHAVFSFSYVSETQKRDKQDGGRSIDLFTNTVFTLIVASFLTSIFAVWQLLDGELTLKLYLLYGVLLFATLHSDVLYRIMRFEKRIDYVVKANYVFIAIVVFMLAILIFAGEAKLDEFFYRLLAACGIVDATLTITAIIMHKLYLQKHPIDANEADKTASEHPSNFWRNPIVVIILIFLFFQVIGSFFALIAGSF